MSGAPSITQLPQAGKARSAAVCRDRRAVALNASFAIIALTVIGIVFQLRWSVAATTRWQCDEVPLLVRSTGITGYAANELEAQRFDPTLYSFRKGAIRSLRAPNHIAAIHTTTGFWVNLTTHLFGVSPLTGRLMPLFWSLVAIVMAAWAAWLIVGRFPAACVAASLVALSPHACAYAAQIRGYAEATALAPALLVALEYLRRRPDSRFRCILCFVIAVQLSLTVYTMWVYWVLPVMVAAYFLLPRSLHHNYSPHILRSMLALIVAALLIFMVMYTVDRWRQLAFTATTSGISVHSWNHVWEQIVVIADHIMAMPVWMTLFVFPGIAVVARSKSAWWLAVGLIAFVAPLTFAMVHGSAGYPRNFGYLVVPVAVLSAVGAQRAFELLSRRSSGLVAGVAAVAMFAGLGATAKAGMRERIDRIILPDWGAAAVSVDQVPETVGPRWFCHSLANHWQINWYRPPAALAGCLELPMGATMEVVLGTQRDEFDREIIFYYDGEAISHRLTPGFIAANPVSSTTAGVSLRRWRATRRDAPIDEAVFLLVGLSNAVEAQEIRLAICGRSCDGNILAFKPVTIGERVVASFILAPDQSSEVQEILKGRQDVHFFSLSKLDSTGSQ